MSSRAGVLRGTEGACGARVVLCDVRDGRAVCCYAVHGTGVAYGAMRYMRMVLGLLARQHLRDHQVPCSASHAISAILLSNLRYLSTQSPLPPYAISATPLHDLRCRPTQSPRFQLGGCIGRLSWAVELGVTGGCASSGGVAVRAALLRQVVRPPPPPPHPLPPRLRGPPPPRRQAAAGGRGRERQEGRQGGGAARKGGRDAQ
eukprot:2313116-Rhodomonas_salina.1